MFALSCRKSAPPPGVIASVGTRTITLDDFTRYLERNAGATLSQLAPQAATALLYQQIEEILLSEKAAQKGINVSKATVAEAMRNDPGSTAVEKEDELRRTRLLAEETAKLPPAAESEIDDYFQKHPEEFRSGEQVHARQILVHTDADAAAALKELQGGETFEAVSKKYSKAPNAARGGDIGLVERGQLPKIFEDVIFTLKPGSISPVVKSDPNFFHIFKVDELRPAGNFTLDQAKPLIEEKLREERLRTAIDQTVKETAEALHVTVYKKRLGFAYNGSYPTEAE